MNEKQKLERDLKLFLGSLNVILLSISFILAFI